MHELVTGGCSRDECTSQGCDFDFQHDEECWDLTGIAQELKFGVLPEYLHR
jgi:hypothetical protein